MGWIKKARKKAKRIKENKGAFWYKVPKVKIPEIIVPRKSRRSGLKLGSYTIDDLVEFVHEAGEYVHNKLYPVQPPDEFT